MQKQKDKKKISKKARIRNTIRALSEVVLERTENNMLEVLLIECVKSLLEEEEIDIGFFPKEGISIESYRKERLGKSHFYIAFARAKGKESFSVIRKTFYISESRMDKAIEKTRSAKIEEVLNGRDNKGK